MSDTIELARRVGSFKNTGYPMSPGQKKRRNAAVRKLEARIEALERIVDAAQAVADDASLDLFDPRHEPRYPDGISIVEPGLMRELRLALRASLSPESQSSQKPVTTEKRVSA